MGTGLTFTYSEAFAQSAVVLTQTAAAAQTDAGFFGSFEMTLFAPESESVFRNLLFYAFLPGGTANEPRKVTQSGSWQNNTDPVTSITFAPQNGTNLLAGFTWSLYGVIDI